MTTSTAVVQRSEDPATVAERLSAFRMGTITTYTLSTAALIVGVTFHWLSPLWLVAGVPVIGLAILVYVGSGAPWRSTRHSGAVQ